MNNEKLYTENEICEILNISHWTLKSWYLWESRDIKKGGERYLPVPYRLSGMKGRPKRWDKKMVDALVKYQENIIRGRNGIHGIYSNPDHFETKNYKKSIENTCNEK